MNDEARAAWDADYAHYRSLSGKAVTGLIFGLFGLMTFLTPWLSFIPFVGFVLSFLGWRAVTQRPLELVGRGTAMSGLVLSLIGLVGGTAFRAYDYATEVPDGFERISFSELQPSRTPEENHPQIPIPKRAVELDGQEVFIKGYVFPDGRRDRITSFILVPDMGTCCFGGDPKLTDMVEVKLQDGQETEYSFRRRKLVGTFHVNLQPQPNAMNKVAVYQLKARLLK